MQGEAGARGCSSWQGPLRASPCPRLTDTQRRDTERSRAFTHPVGGALFRPRPPASHPRLFTSPPHHCPVALWVVPLNAGEQ